MRRVIAGRSGLMTMGYSFVGGKAVAGTIEIPRPLATKSNNNRNWLVMMLWSKITPRALAKTSIVRLRPESVGIDIEKIRPFREGLQRKVGTEQEWNLCHDDRTHLFYRYWTAKEAVLKAVGAGLKGLSKCLITTITDDHHLHLDYQGREWVVEHVYFDGHVAAITLGSEMTKWILESGIGGVDQCRC